jgi:hypothetical protein
MLSGVGVADHGLWWNSFHAERGFIHVPTIFSEAHEHGLTTAMIVGKPKLQHIAIPGTVDHFETTAPSTSSAGRALRAVSPPWSAGARRVPVAPVEPMAGYSGVDLVTGNATGL